MTSQKKTPPKRNIELPDWTDEVKPSEDVMALFYAPTGLPKTGALSPIFPINTPQQVTKPSVPISNEPIDNSSTADITKNTLTNPLVEQLITPSQNTTHYDKSSSTNNRGIQKAKLKEPKPIKPNQVEVLSDRDLFDLDPDLDQKDHTLDQKDRDLDQKNLKNLKNIPYRNPTPYRPDTVSKSDRVSESDTVSKSDTVLNNPPLTKVDLSKGFIAIPTYLLDELAKTLTPTEWTLYLRLFRLSYGWHKDTCIVGLEALVEATNISRTILREALKSLQNRKLIQVIETINSKEIKGTKYRIYTLSESDTVSKSDRVSDSDTVTFSDTVSVSDTIKYIDDHDDLNKDHHQKSQTEHQKNVMMIYQKITGNSWTKADSDKYTKVKNIPIEKIETAIRLTNQRATNRPNSFAYFIKEIFSVANPTKQSRSQQKKILERIVNSLQNSHIGSSYSIANLTYDVKEACIREDVPFDHDLFNEIMKKHKG